MTGSGSSCRSPAGGARPDGARVPGAAMPVLPGPEGTSARRSSWSGWRGSRTRWVERLSGGATAATRRGAGVDRRPRPDLPRRADDRLPTRRRDVPPGRSLSGLRALGKTVFLTTHYMDEAENLADRIAVIARRAYRREGTPDMLGGREKMPALISVHASGRSCRPPTCRPGCSVRSSRQRRTAGRARKRRPLVPTSSCSPTGHWGMGSTCPISTCADPRSRTSTCG